MLLAACAPSPPPLRTIPADAVDASAVTGLADVLTPDASLDAPARLPADVPFDHPPSNPPSDGAASADASPPTESLCDDPAAATPHGFCDATRLLGVALRIPEKSPTLGRELASGGLSLADFDGDGALDVLALIGRDVPVSLFLHRGDHFVDATESWGLGAIRDAYASAVADLDGDGDPDLVVAQAGRAARVLRNDGTRFVATGAPLGADEAVMTLVPWDLDGDGLLDLLVGTFDTGADCDTPLGLRCVGGVRAYRQESPWTFRPMPVDLPPRRVNALRLADWDDDGVDDLLVCADYGMIDGGNLVARVDATVGVAGFSLRMNATARGFDQAIYCMGAGPIDLDHDGRDEFMLSNFGRNVLLHRTATGTVDLAADYHATAYGVAIPAFPPDFRPFDATVSWASAMNRFRDLYLDVTSVETPMTKWSPVVFDYDDDGADDVFIPAGPVGIGLFPEAPLQHPTLLRGTGIRLMDVTDYAGVGATRNVHAAAAGDLDGDGDLDLALLENVTNGVDGRLVILRNLASAGHALTVRAQGLGAARDGIGARVEVWVGGRRIVKRVDGSLSMLANGPNEVHVGLGTATFADRVVVRFRSGAVVTRTHVPAGRITVAEE